MQPQTLGMTYLTQTITVMRAIQTPTNDSTADTGFGYDIHDTDTDCHVCMRGTDNHCVGMHDRHCALSNQTRNSLWCRKRATLPAEPCAMQ